MMISVDATMKTSQRMKHHHLFLVLIGTVICLTMTLVCVSLQTTFFFIYFFFFFKKKKFFFQNRVCWFSTFHFWFFWLPYIKDARATSSAFCNEGSPIVSWFALFKRARTWSIGFPDNSVNFSAIPSRVTMMPRDEIGFWSKYSWTNSQAYCRVSSCRDGRRSFSVMAVDMSMIRYKCRMIPRWIVEVSRSNLRSAE